MSYKIEKYGRPPFPTPPYDGISYAIYINKSKALTKLSINCSANGLRPAGPLLGSKGFTDGAEGCSLQQELEKAREQAKTKIAGFQQQ